jgi:hypothetical protein
VVRIGRVEPRPFSETSVDQVPLSVLALRYTEGPAWHAGTECETPAPTQERVSGIQALSSGRVTANGHQFRVVWRFCR